jgi:threonine/homoserine/homoserine lactone efflux protein
LVGAGFLLLMGLYTLLFKKVQTEIIDDHLKELRKRDVLGIFFSGYLMNTLNPSVFLFWFAWTAAIGADAIETENPTFYKIVVFGTCLLFVLISDLFKVLLAGSLRPKLTEKTMIWINRLSGIIILIFSAALFYTALKY